MGRASWKFKNLSFTNLIISTFKPKPKIQYPTGKKYKLSAGNNIDNISINPVPFLLIKPSGLKHKEKIIKILKDNGVVILNEITIFDYRSLANAMFDNVKIKEQQYWFYILETQYDKSINNHAVALILEDVNLEKLGAIKRNIRKTIGIDFYKIFLQDKWQETSLTPIHSPDEDRLDKEFTAIMRYADYTG